MKQPDSDGHREGEIYFRKLMLKWIAIVAAIFGAIVTAITLLL